MTDTILFDLDGTLVPMTTDDFIKVYFKEIIKKVAPLGYNPENLVKWIWQGTEKMMKNDGSKTNYDAFWDEFIALAGEKSREDIKYFDEFYENEFNNVKNYLAENICLREFIDDLKSKNYSLILATSPIFPYSAAVSRLSWLGLSPDDFDYISTMENSHYTKPNLKYYEEILEKTGKKAENCLMVGNNPAEDMCAKKLGIEVFFMPKYIENKTNEDTKAYPQGDFKDLTKFIDENL